ncbi:uncharacterized protein LOC129757612 [Uranotaenia lowii]|uniref:uncharacterized protein LOC129757612 n=1 Tax=Uranotaenia lowii TaxID=190385 RepID=UPI002479C065|nr:uncharacterized protein LOC129757612 [Uranotaenia lowii]
MAGLSRNIVLLVLICGIVTVCGQLQKDDNGTTYEEVTVSASFYVRRKPPSAFRRTAYQEKEVQRTKREISHSTSHDGSKLKTNALNPSVGHHKQDPIAEALFDKGFNHGESKAANRAFYKQKSVTAKQNKNQL